MGRPPDVPLVVYGAVSSVPSSRRVLVGQRSVITISRARSRDPDHTTLGGRDDGPPPDTSDGDDDDSDYSERPAPASGADRNVKRRPTTARAISSPGRRSGLDVADTSASHHSMWMPVSRHAALPECQQADTPAVNGEIALPLSVMECFQDASPACLHVNNPVMKELPPTVLELSDSSLRIRWLDKDWLALEKGSGGFFDDQSAQDDKPTVISLAVCLPLASASSSQQFDMDHSQCVLPIAEDMLNDFWRCAVRQAVAPA